MTPRPAITVVFFANGALFASWVSRIPALSGRVGASTGVLGVILLVPAIASALSLPLAGRQLTRGSSRALCQLAVVGLMVAVTLPGLAHTSSSLAGALLLLGGAGATLDMAMNAQGVTVERHLGKPILASLHAAFSFGGVAGAAGGAIASAAGVTPFAHLLVAAVLFGFPGLLATRSLLAARDDDLDAGVPHPRWRALSPRLLILGVACFFGLLAEGAAGDWSAKLVSTEPLGSPSVGALAYAAFSLGMASGRLAADRLWARWGSAGLIRRGAGLATVAITVSLIIGSAPAGIAGFLVLGLGLSSNVPTLFRSAAGETGVPTGAALGTVSSLGYVGFLVGPPMIGGIAQLTSLRLACGLLALSGLMLAALAPYAQIPPRPQPQPTIGATA